MNSLVLVTLSRSKQYLQLNYNLTKENLTMSNLTNSTNSTNSTQVITMENSKKSGYISTIASELFHNGLTPAVSLVSAAAYVGAVDYIADTEDFMEALIDGLNNTAITVKDQEIADELDGDTITKAFMDAGYLTEDGIGSRLSELLALETSAYKPVVGKIERRFNYSPVAHSELFVEAVHALESSEYTVDEYILSVALQVQAKMGGEDKDAEAHVIRGCQEMDAELAYVSEFKGDRRGRLYQASCHGPNGQSSDRSRALPTA